MQNQPLALGRPRKSTLAVSALPFVLFPSALLPDFPHLSTDHHPSTPQFPFPAEVIALILDLLSTGDLARLARLTRHFRPYAQRALKQAKRRQYRCVTIDLVDVSGHVHTTPEFDDLCDAFQADPTLANEVEEVSCSMGSCVAGDYVEEYTAQRREGVAPEDQYGWDPRWEESDLDEEEEADRAAFLDEDRAFSEGEYDEAIMEMMNGGLEDWDDAFNALPHFPRLRYLSIDDYSGDGNWSSSFPRSLEGRNITLADSSVLPDGGTTLSIATIRHDSVRRYRTPIALERLEVLDVGSMSDHTDSGLILSWLVSKSLDSLTHLTLPLHSLLDLETLTSLTSLTLLPTDKPWHSFPTIEPLPPSLTSLTFSRRKPARLDAINVDNAASITRLLPTPPPSLTALTMGTPGLTPDVVLGLLCRGRKEEWLPKLETLEINLRAGRGEEGEVLWTEEKRVELSVLCEGRGIGLVVI